MIVNDLHYADLATVDIGREASAMTCQPCAPAANGAPLGFQLAAARGRKDLLLRAGIAFQRETLWHLNRPID
ncbi:hypothetical protein [Sphingobium sp. TKS]|uniref:hypothetical protein n=1 Tax=Sphingobium sp. TKS TaxID=1315974 RepID=UPI000770073D|nr:hypothetical protein [Sphingobium sp. TKS]AMK21921.1 amidase [Sphingobium sp. TKS]AMK23464.1 amidase [Sphingobium sp. TKS]